MNAARDAGTKPEGGPRTRTVPFSELPLQMPGTRRYVRAEQAVFENILPPRRTYVFSRLVVLGCPVDRLDRSFRLTSLCASDDDPAAALTPPWIPVSREFVRCSTHFGPAGIARGELPLPVRAVHVLELDPLGNSGAVGRGRPQRSQARGPRVPPSCRPVGCRAAEHLEVRKPSRPKR